MTEANISADMRAKIARLTAANDPFASELVYTRMDMVQPRDIEWLWTGWLPRGKLTILGGHPGDGKSTLIAALVAAFSQGGLLPDGTPAPVVNTALLLAEDDLEDTVRPRLDLHGAQTSRVIALEAVREPGGKDRFLNLGAHIDLIKGRVRDSDIGLLVIDPLTSFLPRTDRNNEGDIRDALMPLLRLAQDEGLAIIAVMHMSKSSGGQRTPLQQLLGSTAFGAMARVVWMVTKMPEGDSAMGALSAQRRLVGVIKSNVSVILPTLAWSRERDAPITWHGPAGISIEDALAGAATVPPREEAASFLQDRLKGGMKRADEIKQRAREVGISEQTLRRAREELNVELIRLEFQGPVWWKLPNGPRSTPEDHQSTSGAGQPADTSNGNVSPNDHPAGEARDRPQRTSP